MSESIIIRPYTTADFSAIIAISDDRLGKNYINRTELAAYLNNKYKIGLVALVKNEIAGFALAQICEQNEVMSLVLDKQDWFTELFLNKYPIGILKTIAVHSEFSNLGVGTALTKHRIEILKKSSDTIMAISWEQKQETANTQILEKSGLKLKRKIENYWLDDSILKGYYCKLCGNPPCKCTALIYILNFISSSRT